MFDTTGDRFRDLLEFDTDDSKFQFWREVLPRLTPEQFAALKNAIAAGIWAGRIVIDEIGRLLYGHDAYYAFRQLGVPPRHIVQVKVGDRTAAEVESLIRLWRYCDGGPINQAEKRDTIRRQLRVTPDWSDAAIARLLGCTDKTVAGVRAAMEETSEIPRFRCQGGRGISRGLPMVLYRDRSEAKRNAAAFRDANGLKGHTTPKQLRRAVVNDIRHRKAQDHADVSADQDFRVECCGFRDLKIEPASVDVGFTDPPWG